MVFDQIEAVATLCLIDLLVLSKDRIDRHNELQVHKGDSSRNELTGNLLELVYEDGGIRSLGPTRHQNEDEQEDEEDMHESEGEGGGYSGLP